MSSKKEKNLRKLADKCGMSEKTARKYLKSGKSPEEMRKPHTWQTRANPFKDIWGRAKEFLENNPGLEAKSLFEYLQKEYPEKYSDGQLRTFQRKVKEWKISEGPPQEVMFSQIHYPGKLCSIDYTNMTKLGITIAGELFKHLIFHFVLTYSNWETGKICYSESLASLIEGVQKSLWQLGGVPEEIRSDNLSAAVYKDLKKTVFTDRYHSLLKHYGLKGSTINAGKANENGDIEQRNRRFKKAVEQALILRGSRNFHSLEEYNDFLKKLFSQLNSGRAQRFQEEVSKLKSLPKTKIDNFKVLHYKVGPTSTLNIAHNVYSVDSRLIGSQVKVLLKADTIAIYYGNKKIDEFQRLKGTGKHKINYRHIIDSLKRKPGAFENYRYRDELFPTTQFRKAYDYLKRLNPSDASKEYVNILSLAVEEGEEIISQILSELLSSQQEISYLEIHNNIKTIKANDICNVTVEEVSPADYDVLIENPGVLYG